MSTPPNPTETPGEAGSPELRSEILARLDTLTRELETLDETLDEQNVDETAERVAAITAEITRLEDIVDDDRYNGQIWENNLPAS